MIKDKTYWKEYNAKRKAYIQQKNKERYLKSSINTTNRDTTENNTTPQINTTNTTIPPVVLKKDTTTEPIQPINTTQGKQSFVRDQKIIQPEKRLIQPNFNPNLTPPEIVLEKIKELLLVYQRDKEPDKVLKAQRYYADLLTYLKWVETKLLEAQNKQIKELKNQIQELQNPINPTIELWKKRYFDLEKEFHHKGAEQSETIIRLKEKLREKDNEKQQLIEKYSQLEKRANYKESSLSMPNLYALISKHKKIQSIQWKYSERDIKEREFLKNLLNQLWDFN